MNVRRDSDGHSECFLFTVFLLTLTETDVSSLTKNLARFGGQNFDILHAPNVKRSVEFVNICPA